MACVLCMCHGDSSRIELTSTESTNSNIPETLYKYFHFYFITPPLKGGICRKCWNKVQDFHHFCNQIEATRRIQLENAVLVEKTTSKFDSDTKDSFALLPIHENNAMNSLHENANTNELFRKVETQPGYEIVFNSNCDEKRNIANALLPIPDVKCTKKKYKPRRPEDEGSYRCDMCNIYFFTDWKLEHHMKINHLVLPFKCTIRRCVESFETAELLAAHVEQSHPQTQCPYCDKMIVNILLRRHVRVHHRQEERTVCDLCGQVSATRRQHRDHYQWKHEVQEKLECDICGVLLKNKDTMRAHLKIKHIQKPETCQVCGKVSPNRKAMNKHKQIHLSDTKNRYKCVVCGKGFRTNTQIKEHSYIHSGVTDAYRCNFCDRTFRFGSSLSAHKKKAHPLDERKTANDDLD